MKRARYKELEKVADEICTKLIEAGIKPNEGCIVRRIAETQWDCLRASYDEVHGRGGQLSNAVCAEQPCDTAAPSELSDNL